MKTINRVIYHLARRLSMHFWTGPERGELNQTYNCLTQGIASKILAVKVVVSHKNAVARGHHEIISFGWESRALVRIRTSHS